MSKILVTAPSGAMINIDSIDSIYMDYRRGCDIKIKAVVGGVDMTIAIVPVPNDLESAEATAVDVMKKFASECGYVVR